MDELRFATQRSPPRSDLTTMNSLVSPPRNGGNRTSQPPLSHDHRSVLPRRFTADSGRVPTVASLHNAQRMSEAQDMNGAQTYQKVQLLEKKRLEYEKIREQRRRFELEMYKLDQTQRREELELAQMQEDIGRLAGQRSEPTTPPEYRETPTGFPTLFSRPNRYSLSSITSPSGMYQRGNRSSTIMTPPTGGAISQFGYADQPPSRSTPGSRRNSDEDEKEEAVRQDPSSHRSSNALNRYSMPVTKSRSGFYDLGLDQANTTRFLFGDEEATAPKTEAQLYASTSDDNFPTLVRRDDHIALAASAIDASGKGSRPASIRHSLEMKPVDAKSYESAFEDQSNSSTINNMHPTPPKLQSSFSANDIPTVKTMNGPNGLAANVANNPAAQQYLHNHNAAMGRIPAGAMVNRQSREMTLELNAAREALNGYHTASSTLQANAPSFGPSATQALPHATTAPAMLSDSNNGQLPPMYAGSHFASATPYGLANSAAAYQNGMTMLSLGMQNLNMAPPGNLYQPPSHAFAGYNSMYAPSVAPIRDSQARVIQSRRAMDGEAMSRFNNLSLDQVGGTIYELCKDQHGCRFLQKQLENRVPEQIHMIWLETNQHVTELMTDPFGNYLCQKLLEYCNDEERTVLIQNASTDMVRIAVNQHGTRALQKMIEFVSTPQQISIIIESLRYQVVELIQDLNGNHVIQKCLNKLSAADAEFIFHAVGEKCVEVGTHRHGCCVLQRCIDHASGEQKRLLIHQITQNAVTLIQDPFGNYVVQYIIDLAEPSFTEPLVAMFKGRIIMLSRHKFSSNVVEKSLRCSQDASRDMIVGELLNPIELERLLRDSYANYVLQTALEHATYYMKIQLVDMIRPLLPSIRTTPYGRRIQAKVQAYDAQSGRSSGQATPLEGSTGQPPMRATPTRGSISGGLSNVSSSIGTFTPASSNVSTPNGSIYANGSPGDQLNKAAGGFKGAGSMGYANGVAGHAAAHGNSAYTNGFNGISNRAGQSHFGYNGNIQHAPPQPLRAQYQMPPPTSRPLTASSTMPSLGSEAAFF